MDEHRIKPERITRPIQLLAAWLTGLVLVDGGFLTAALYLKQPNWAPGFLVVAAVLNVPIFLAAIFLLQTRFRPEMQEDTYYSQYLERKHSIQTDMVEPLDIEEYARELTEHIVKELGPSVEESRKPLEQVIRESKVQELVQKIHKSKALCELFLRPHFWHTIVKMFKGNPQFESDLRDLLMDGLVIVDLNNPIDAKITELGYKVAMRAQEAGVLYSQTNFEKWDEKGRALACSK